MSSLGFICHDDLMRTPTDGVYTRISSFAPWIMQILDLDGFGDLC